MQKKRILSLLLVIVTIFAMMVPFSGVSAAEPTTKPANAKYDRDAALSLITDGSTAADKPWALFTSADGGQTLTFVKTFTVYDDTRKDVSERLVDYIEGEGSATQEYYALLRRNCTITTGGYGSVEATKVGSAASRILNIDLGTYTWDWNYNGRTCFVPGAFSTVIRVYGGKLDWVKDLCFVASGGRTTGFAFEVYNTTIRTSGSSSSSGTPIFYCNGATTGSFKVSFTNVTFDLTTGVANTRPVYQSKDSATDTVADVVELKECITIQTNTIDDAKDIGVYFSGNFTLAEADKKVVQYKAGGATYDYQKQEIVETEPYVKGTYDRAAMIGQIDSSNTKPWAVFDNDKNLVGTYASYGKEGAMGAIANLVSVDKTYYIFLLADYTYGSGGNDGHVSSMENIGGNIVIDLTGYTFDCMGVAPALWPTWYGSAFSTKKNLSIVGGTIENIKQVGIGGMASGSGAYKIDFIDTKIVVDAAAPYVVNITKSSIGGEGKIVTRYNGCEILLNNVTNTEYTLMKSNLTEANKKKGQLVFENGTKIIYPAWADTAEEKAALISQGYIDLQGAPTEVALPSTTTSVQRMSLLLTSEIAPKLLVAADSKFAEAGVIYKGQLYTGVASEDYANCYEITLPVMSAADFADLTVEAVGVSFGGNVVSAGNTKDIDVVSYCNGLGNLGKSVLAYAKAMGADVNVDYTCAITKPTYETETVVPSGNIFSMEFAASTTTGFTVTTASLGGNENYVLKVTCGNEYMWVTGTANGVNNNFAVNQISASKLAEEFSFEVYDAVDGNSVSAVYTYSFVEYADANNDAVFAAMVNYGLEAKAYVNNAQ